MNTTPNKVKAISLRGIYLLLVGAKKYHIRTIRSKQTDQVKIWITSSMTTFLIDSQIALRYKPVIIFGHPDY